MSSALNSAINRIEQVQQVREVCLEATATDAATGETFRGASAVYKLTNGRAMARSAVARLTTGGNRVPHSAMNRLSGSTKVPIDKEGASYHESTTGASAIVVVEGDHLPAAADDVVGFIDPSSPTDLEALRQSVNRRRIRLGHSAPNRLTAARPTSSGQQHIPTGGGDDKPIVVHTEEEASLAVAEAALSAAEAEQSDVAPFPLRRVACIIACQLIAAAPPTVFAALSPYMYAALVGDMQTAGTVSSLCTGGSMVLQMVMTPILAQVMDMYGRRPLAVFTAIKSLVGCVPLLVAGIVISRGMDGVDVPEGANPTSVHLGMFLPSADQRIVKGFFALFWVFSLINSATNSSHSLVAIGDVCQSQHARTAGIGAFAGLAYTLAAFAMIGAKLSLVAGAAVAVGLGVVGVIAAFFVFPETITKSNSVVAAQLVGVPSAASSATAASNINSAVNINNRRIGEKSALLSGEEEPSRRATEQQADNRVGDTESHLPLNTIIAIAPPLPHHSTTDSSTRRRCTIYPSQIKDRGSRHQSARNNNNNTVPFLSASQTQQTSNQQNQEASSVNMLHASTVADTDTIAINNDVSEDQTYASNNNNRRIHICINPFRGFYFIRRSQISLVALGVLFTCLMAEISASDTLVYYLTIKLGFTPSDVSTLQIEQSILALFLCGFIGPLLSKYLACARICMICAVAILSSLITLSVAESKVVIFAVFAPCISLGTIMMPSIAAVITRDASKPEDVSLSIGTLMSLVALLQAGASFLAAIVFKMLPPDHLWVTFVVAACFTVPMFFMSVWLDVLCRREQCEKSEEQTQRESAAQSK